MEVLQVARQPQTQTQRFPDICSHWQVRLVFGGPELPLQATYGEGGLDQNENIIGFSCQYGAVLISLPLSLFLPQPSAANRGL